MSAIALALFFSVVACEDTLLRGGSDEMMVPEVATHSKCYKWKEAFPLKNHVFLNTLSGPNSKSVQMGYVSSIYDQYPNAYESGQPTISSDLAKRLCDHMNILGNFCAAVQFFKCPNPSGPGWVTWADLLTQYEYNLYHGGSGQYINSTIVTGVAYERVPC